MKYKKLEALRDAHPDLILIPIETLCGLSWPRIPVDTRPLNSRKRLKEVPREITLRVMDDILFRCHLNDVITRFLVKRGIL